MGLIQTFVIVNWGQTKSIDIQRNHYSNSFQNQPLAEFSHTNLIEIKSKPREHHEINFRYQSNSKRAIVLAQNMHQPNQNDSKQFVFVTTVMSKHKSTIIASGSLA